MLILNYTLCVPVIMAVGMFSLFHFWSIASNTTTIEGWEKDKVAVLKRKGKIREVSSLFPLMQDLNAKRCPLQYKYPYDLGVIANVQSVLGKNPLFWCWPQRMHGTGLRYSVGHQLGKFSDEDPDEARYTRPRKDRESDWEDMSDSV
jgi:palmitoyltransferase